MAAEWDNIGLVIGNPDAKANGIVMALDVTDEVISMAEKTGSNLIIAHHPPIFSPVRKINPGTAGGHIISRLLKSDIAVFVIHTNLDSSPQGLNRHLANVLGLVKTRAIKSGSITYRIGFLDKTADSLALAKTIKKILGLANIRHYGPGRKVKKVAVCSGSGGELLEHAREKGAEVLITGDVRHHVGVESEILGFPVIDAGHAGTERIMAAYAAEKIKKNLTKTGKRIKIKVFQIKEGYISF